MKFQTIKKIGAALLACSLFLGGCAAQQVQQTQRYVWPRAPEQPKIEWIKSYYSQHDFPKSGFASFLETLFGQSPAIGFQKPIDIKSNGKGIVYIADIALSAIIVYDLNNATVDVWERGTDPDKSLSITPYYLALDRDNNIYTVGSGGKNIVVLDSKGAVLRKINFAEQVKAPAGITIDKESGRIYLVDNPGGKVAVYESSGKFLFSFGKPGTEDGEFNRPSPITINNKGEVVVGDVMNARIQVFTKEGKFLRKFGQRGDAASDFQVIKGLSVDSDDNVYVTDGKANQIKIFNAKGEYLLGIGTAYSVTATFKEAPGGLLLPQGIHIDDTDTIYLADQANMRFQIFKYLGGARGASVKEPAVTGK